MIKKAYLFAFNCEYYIMFSSIFPALRDSVKSILNTKGLVNRIYSRKMKLNKLISVFSACFLAALARKFMLANVEYLHIYSPIERL